MIPPEWLDQAEARIAPHIVRTPLTFDAAHNLYIKWENQQQTGSFKARGALNKILSLSESERTAGIVTASAGNHGQGVGFAGQLVGAKVICFVSESAVPFKVERIRALGAEVRTVAGGYAETESTGREFALKNKMTWVSPYNDELVIAGQGTIGLEIMTELRPSAKAGWGLTVFVPVGGGGLISGIALALGRSSPRPRIVGVQPETNPFMYGLFYRGSQDGIPELPSLADGLTGAVEGDSITIDLVKKLVDDILLVSEDEIAAATAYAFHTHRQVIEPSGAVTIAAAMRAEAGNGLKVAVVSGGNAQPEVHARLVANYAGTGRR